MSKVSAKMDFFERYLSLWVLLCILGGMGLGVISGDTIQKLSQM